VPFWTSSWYKVSKKMLNSRKSVTAITILLLISSVIGGCFGNEDEEVYSGPIDIVLILSADSGTLEISKGNGNETIDQQTNSVEIEFDLSNIP